MQPVQRVSEDVLHEIQHREPNESEVITTLEAILASPPFRTSKQCQSLLRYIVKHSLLGDEASLRERILGVEVFSRAADYDTSEDPVVRMRAGDVRKRLAQYYQSNENTVPAVHIELKPGSYKATFRYEDGGETELPIQAMSEVAGASLKHEQRAAVIPSPAVAVLDAKPTLSRPWLRAKVVLAAVLLLALLSVGGWRIWKAYSITAQQRFWTPITHSNQPMLLYVGSNAVYIVRPEYLAKYKLEHGLKVNGPEFFIDLPKGGVIQADILKAVKDTFVSVDDLAASAQIVSLMNIWNKPFILRSGADVTMGDLRNAPAVLIGGFNNPWTLETTGELPFSFQDGTRIVDRDHAGRNWTVSGTSYGEETEDYALISRLLHSNTGGPVIVIGGIGSFGTRAAAEFVSSPEKMSGLLKSAPAGWETKNMQAVLRIKVVGFAPVAVDVVATSYW